MIMDALSAGFIALGCVLSLVGGLGIHRFNDFYARLHAVGITDTLCTFLILAGLRFSGDRYIGCSKTVTDFPVLVFHQPNLVIHPCQ